MAKTTKILELCKTYIGTKQHVKVEEEIFQYFNISSGCVLSPDPFNLFTEFFFKEIDDMNGIKVDGKNITNLYYVDEAVLLAFIPEHIQQMLDWSVIMSEKKGLQLNVRKTESMMASKKGDNLIFKLTSKGETIKQFKSSSFSEQTSQMTAKT